MNDSAGANKGAFRVKDWWWSKAALLMGMVYLFTARYHIPFGKFIPLSLLSLTTITGFASLGYLFNDMFDIEKDRLAGKRNFLAGRSAGTIILLFLLSATFVLAPWYWLPKDNFSFILIGLQLVLFIIYSAPPIRLKEQGLAGIVTDALYAHGIPPVLAAYTFALAGNYPFTVTDIAFLFAWQTLAGFRNILIHQAEDMPADRISGSRNFVAGIAQATFQEIVTRLISMELLLGGVYFSVLGYYHLPFYLFLSLSVSLALFLLILPRLLKSPGRYFPNNIYEKWLPVAYLLLLGGEDLRFIILFVIHLLLFNFDFYVQTADKIYGRWKSVAFTGMLISLKIWLSYPVNYFIYYSLRIFGVDLKKENVSAAQYLRKLLGGDKA